MAGRIGLQDVFAVGGGSAFGGRVLECESWRLLCRTCHDVVVGLVKFESGMVGKGRREDRVESIVIEASKQMEEI